MDVDPQNRRKLVYASLVGIGLLVALIWYASPDKILAILKAADFRLILAAWTISLMATVVRTFRFSMFVSIRQKVVRTYAVFSLARFINMAFPFRTGDLAMLALLKRAGIVSTIANLLPVWLVLRVSDAMALAVWFSVAVALSAVGREYLPAGVSIVVIALGVLFFMQYVVLIFPRRFLENTDNWVVGRIAAVVEGVRASKGVSKRIVASLAALLIWGLLIAAAVLAQLAFHTPLSIQSALLAAIFAASFSIIPINTPMAVGTGEVMWTAAMMLVGVPLESAIPLAIGVRVSAVSILIIEGAAGGSLLLWLPAPNDTTVEAAKTT